MNKIKDIQTNTNNKLDIFDVMEGTIKIGVDLVRILLANQPSNQLKYREDLLCQLTVYGSVIENNQSNSKKLLNILNKANLL